MHVLKSQFDSYDFYGNGRDVSGRLKSSSSFAADVSSYELGKKLGELIRSDRKITNEILKLISIGLDQRSYLDLGYPSMFEWLTKGFGYSNAAAFRRIEAARLLKSLSEESKNDVESKIEQGEVNLTTLSKIQSTIKAHEKVSGKKVATELKEEVIRKVTANKNAADKDDGDKGGPDGGAAIGGLSNGDINAEINQGCGFAGGTDSSSSSRTGFKGGKSFGVSTGFERKSEEETQKILFQLLPDAQTEILQDRKKVISEDLTRHSITFTKEMSEDLKRVKEVISHICPNGTDQEVIAYALKFLLKKKDSSRRCVRESRPDQKPMTEKSARKSEMEHKSLTQIASAAEAACVIEERGRTIEQTEFEIEVRAEPALRSCSFKDPRTGKTCGSRFQLQTDHILPKALGGTDDPKNLRTLCRQHNLHAAEKYFGRKFMGKYRGKSR